MEQVIWKDIRGYKGYYQVSSHGDVRSLDRTIKIGNKKVRLKGKLLAQSTDASGYKHLRLRKKGKEKNFFVHRLVAKAFVENKRPRKDIQINHKDENKKNNHYTNLEWCTAAYNANYGTRNQRISKPVIASNDKETLYFSSMTEASLHSFVLSCISKAVATNKPHKGYYWRLA